MNMNITTPSYTVDPVDYDSYHWDWPPNYVHPYPYYPQPYYWHYYPAPVSYPHTCPVCGGKGKVPAGFYDIGHNAESRTAASPETCSTCWGSGVLWR